jgi:hypothetical protein
MILGADEHRHSPTAIQSFNRREAGFSCWTPPMPKTFHAYWRDTEAQSIESFQQISAVSLIQKYCRYLNA